MLSLEQDEAVFAAGLRVAEKLACDGHDQDGAVRGAQAVVAAAKAAQKALDAEDEQPHERRMAHAQRESALMDNRQPEPECASR